MLKTSQNRGYDSFSADLASSAIPQDTDCARPPRCRTCKKTMDTTFDRQKHRDKWWTICTSCRAANTNRCRGKRELGLTEPRQSHPPRQPAEGFVNEQLDWTKKAKSTGCGECGKHPYNPWITACGHLMCNTCYEGILMLAANLGHVNGTCGTCGELFLIASPYEQEGEEMFLVESTKKRKRVLGLLRLGNHIEDGRVENKSLNPAKSVQALTECSVCGDFAPSNQCPELPACTHKSDICKECFLGWLDSQIDSTIWEQIQCPSNGCNQPITHADVKTYGSDDLFTRFDELSMRALLSNDPNFRYCLAEGCNSGQIHDLGSGGNIFRCNACNFRLCTIHDVPFHTGETCAQYDERSYREEEQGRKEDEHRQEQDGLSRAEIQTSTTKCPGCEVPIHKYIACDHITCSRCKFQFCYICRAPYQGENGIWLAGNKIHSTKCKYHPNMLPDYQEPEAEEMGSEEAGSEDAEPEDSESEDSEPEELTP